MSKRIHVSSHAIVRFKERSKVPGCHGFSEGRVASMICKLIGFGKVVHAEGVTRKRFEIVKVPYSIEDEVFVLYFLTRTNGNKRRVITVFTQSQFKEWQCRPVH